MSMPTSSHMAEGIMDTFLGPMPPQEFLSEFFPSRSVPSKFEEGHFKDVLAALKNEGLEKAMYEPFRSAVRDVIPKFIIRNTSTTLSPAGTDYTFDIKPDLVVLTKENEASKNYGAVAEFFLEFKCDVDPFVASPTTPSAAQPQDEELCLFPDSDSSLGGSNIGQIATYIAIQMDSQYRTHTFFVLLMEKYARLMRWDRSGAIYTDRIHYDTEPELFEFFEAYNEATPEARGIDEFVTEPTPVEINDARQTCPDLGESLLIVSIHNPDLHAQPHRYVINRPSPRSSLPTGRSTRTSVAYDVQEKKRVFFKDSWRAKASNAPAEGKVYQTLNQRKVRNIPTCVDYCDVGTENYHQTQVQSFVQRDWVPRHHASLSFTVYRHHRLVLGTVGKELEEFASTKEMVKAVRAALVAHKEAYLEGILHRDISTGNILITKEDGFEGGMLIDWDLCKVRDGEEGHVQSGDRRPNRAGTWLFMAADLVENPYTLQTFSHDLESVFYVIFYLAGFYREATWSRDERSVFFHHILNPRVWGQTPTGGTGGTTKRLFICSTDPEFTVKDNLVLTDLLDKLKKVVQSRYRPLVAAKSTFLDLQAYEDLPYNHDRIIHILDDALQLQSTDPSRNWPVGDFAIEQEIIPLNQ